MSFFITDALAEGAPAAQGSDPMSSLIFFGGMIVIFYFLLIRPQQKKAKEHRNMVTALSKGDEVVTGGGLLGKITEVGEEYITVEIGDKVAVKMQKQAITTVLPKGTIKAASK
ncbi:Protein translocase subunit YajC [hydrothermal vent metagenome]|uniref:Protein translocase subunit YajC n=1 Tax=hydrothermal vent metagenome TaxID=652676 RepID=A0A3B1AUC3_9ZZZZ